MTSSVLSRASSDETVGSARWADRIRRRAKALAFGLGEGQVELARLLHYVYNTPIGNDPKNAPLHVDWGFRTFRQYAEDELSLTTRKADYLRQMGTFLEVKATKLSPDLQKRLTRLGWTKLREIVKVLWRKCDEPLARKWVEVAEQQSWKALSHTVGKALDRMGVVGEEVVEDVTDEKYQGADDEEDDEEEEEEEEEEGEEEEGESSGSRRVQEKAKSKKSEEDEAALPQFERTKVFTFLAVNEQIDNILEAFDRVDEIARYKGHKESESKSFKFSLICIDFLSNNDWGTRNDPKMFSRYVRRLEKAFGVKFIAVKKNEVVYGHNTLKRLAQEED